MAKSRRKKNEKKDFKKVKLRVGRKVAKTTDTKLSFVAKKICLREETEKEEAASSSTVLYLSTILPRLNSRRNDDLVAALGDLRLWMRRQPEDARQQLLVELPTKISPLVRHLDAKVRAAAGKVFCALVQLTCSLPAYYPALAQAMFGTLLHFDVGVREDGWTLLRQMLDTAPKALASLNCERLLEELSRRIPLEAASLSSARAARILKTVERLVQTLDPICPLEENRTATTSLISNNLSQPFRLARFDFQPESLKDLWRSDHLPRAKEQGLGWEGTGSFQLADFLSAISNWIFCQCKEFACLDSALRAAEGKARFKLLDRLFCLLSLLTYALQYSHFRFRLTGSARGHLGSAAALLWELFPVPKDSPIFSATKTKAPDAAERLNLGLVRLNCLQHRVTNDTVFEADVGTLGTYFNDVMGPLWPLPRWLCLQWIACALIVVVGGVGSQMTDLMGSIVQRIAGSVEEGSKVALGCQRVAQAMARIQEEEGE